MIRALAVRGAAVALALSLAACGSRVDLQPEAGGALPVAPYGRDEQPTAEELLARQPQAAPERSVELRRRSEEREDDPFDLPPEEMGWRSRGPAAKPARACDQPAPAQPDPLGPVACNAATSAATPG
jgi:hypothetical protein